MLAFGLGSLLYAAFSHPIAFSASLEGSVIEMKLGAPIPEDSLKAQLAKLLLNRTVEQKSRKAYIVGSHTLV